MALSIPVPQFPPTVPVEELTSPYLYFLTNHRVSDPFAKVVLAGPSAEGEYIMYEKEWYMVVEVAHRPIAGEYQIVLVVTKVNPED